ncbi:MAG: phosphonate C-P lyase system protein PhnH [Spirochaetota bacterium]
MRITVNEQGLLEQLVFRTVLNAFSRPSEIFTLPGDELLQERFGPKSWPLLILSSFLVPETKVCIALQDHSESDEMTDFIARKTGAIPASVEEADFVVLFEGDQEKLLRAKRGKLEYPDEGATVIYSIDALDPLTPNPENNLLKIRLQGPGIEHNCCLTMTGIQSEAISCLRKVNQDFPLGVDVLLVDSRGFIAGVPRSANITILGEE